MFQFRFDDRDQIVDIPRIQAMLEAEGLPAWAALIGEQLDRALYRAPHGDWASWRRALAGLPSWAPGHVRWDDGALTLVPDSPPTQSELLALRQTLMVLHPWRKGPYRIGGIHIDSEWRSDWKWQRIAPHAASLEGRLVLDVGCANGYHCWRIAAAGARRVIGIDPTALYLAQYLAVRHLLAPLDPDLAERVEMLPLGVEDLPRDLRRFDTVLSMGILYHRRSPIDHLLELRSALRPGGELILETLVMPGADDRVLVPRGRYAKMRNVWFIPTVSALQAWMARCGFTRIRTLDPMPTGTQEQRSTEWMRFESLADFLDPADSRFTIEGHPAPCRAVFMAES